MNVIVSFSGRSLGNCGKIAEICKNIVPDSKVFRFADFTIQPCGSCNYDCFSGREACPHFDDMEFALLNAITHADSALYILPNYCDYPNANFFIFNERSQCYFQGYPELLDKYLRVPKKFIVISSGPRPSFAEAFAQHTAQVPNILYLSAKQYGRSSIAGDLTESANAVSALEMFILGDQNG